MIRTRILAGDQLAAGEMVRVTKSGGRIVMGNWIPDDSTLVAQILGISAAYSPPPPAGFVSPVTWGSEEAVIERFGVAGIPPRRSICSTLSAIITGRR